MNPQDGMKVEYLSGRTGEQPSRHRVANAGDTLTNCRMHNLQKHIRDEISRLRDLSADRSGAAAVMLALALSTVLGLAGLGTEVAAWYTTKQTMQGAADAAAFTAITAKSAGASVTQMRTEAKSIAGKYNFTDGSGGVTVTVNSPPTSGAYAGKSTAVEVIISQPQTPLISGVIMSSGPTIQARSVAASVESGSGCVVALDTGNIVDVTESGSSVLNITGCSLYINSSATAALSMKGSATIDAGAAYITGGVSIGGSAELNTTKGTYTGTTPINDPYAGTPVPNYTSCAASSSTCQKNYSNNSSTPVTINATGTTPYVFTGGLNLGAQASLTLGPGIYVIDGGSFSPGAQSTLTATSGTTIVLSGNSTSGYATASIGGGASLSITAPTTGSTMGLAIFQDPTRRPAAPTRWTAEGRKTSPGPSISRTNPSNIPAAPRRAEPCVRSSSP
jgi:Flp pilus assembly protein TadG